MGIDRSWACRVLTNARFEVLPNIRPEKVAEALPPGAKVTVTSSPKQGPEATIDLAAALAQRRFKVVPHLAARSIEGRAQVERMLKRMASLGIDEAFVIGGDPERPAGPYSSAHELLEEIASMPERPATLGVAAYPEGHPHIPDDVLMAALLAKQRYASYAIMQISFNPDAIVEWISRAREAGLRLPLYHCLPGIIRIDRLFRIGVQLGLGASLRYLEKQRSLTRFLMTGGTRYDPWITIRALAEQPAEMREQIIGIHWSTFNQVRPTAEWIDQQRRELDCPPTHRG